jgi:hypothetical protein
VLRSMKAKELIVFHGGVCDAMSGGFEYALASLEKEVAIPEPIQGCPWRLRDLQ